MAQKFIIAADRARLRIYRYSQQPGQFTPSIQPVDALDLAESRSAFLSNDTDLGRYSGSRNRSMSMPVEEQVPTQTDRERRIVDQLADRITMFLEKSPNSTWDLAAGSQLRDELIEALPVAVRHRLDQVISKDLINVPPAELREHFALR